MIRLNRVNFLENIRYLAKKETSLKASKQISNVVLKDYKKTLDSCFLVNLVSNILESIVINFKYSNHLNLICSVRDG